MLIVSILGCMGLLFCYILGLFEVRNLDMLYESIYENGMGIIFDIFFFLVALYCWILFFKIYLLSQRKKYYFCIKLIIMNIYL